MRLVTRNQYTRVMTENIDGMHDIAFNADVPANTPVTVHETFTVPAGYVGVLRNATGMVVGTAVAGQATTMLRMTRPGQSQLVVFQFSSDAGLATQTKIFTTPYNIIMPEGTVVEAIYANYDGNGPRRVQLYLAIDLIRL